MYDYKGMRVLSDKEIKERIQNKDLKGLFFLFDDGSEAEIDFYADNVEELVLSHIEKGGQIGEEKKLPKVGICPKCGRKMFVSYNKNYAWECFFCDEDFYDGEVSEYANADMKMEHIYTFGHDEIHSELYYEMISETYNSPRWISGKRKRLFDLYFDKEQQKKAIELCKKCSRWHLKTGTPKSFSMTREEYRIWTTLLTLCSEL